MLNKSEIFSLAHKIAKDVLHTFDNYREAFSYALSEAYDQIREKVKKIKFEKYFNKRGLWLKNNSELEILRQVLLSIKAGVIMKGIYVKETTETSQLVKIYVRGKLYEVNIIKTMLPKEVDALLMNTIQKIIH